jgi:ATP-binding protein involved in chromosome partitioning
MRISQLLKSSKIKGIIMPLPMLQKKIPAHPLSSVKAIIAVAAGKGGVGKSSVTVNLALALKAMGYQVGVMDTDIYGPSVRRMLPEDRFPSQKGTLITPALCAGIKMISMAYFRKENEAAVVRAPIANGVVSQFINNVDWGSLDFLLIDFPPGTGDVQLTLSQQANLTGALMVTTPQEVALMDVRKAMHMFDQVKVPLIGVIENMSYYLHPGIAEPIHIFGKGGGERLAREMGIPFLGQIPIDPEICQSGDRGQSLFARDANHQRPATRAFMHLADQVVAHIKVLKEETNNCLSNFELKWKEMESHA